MRRGYGRRVWRGTRRTRLRIFRAAEDRKLVERVRHRPGGDDPRNRNRAGDGDRAGRRVDPGHLRDHGQRLAAVPVPRGAVGDDARPHRRLTVLRLPRVQGSLAAVRRACQRLHGLGVLAGLVPGRAAEHDPGVVLHRRPLPPLDRRLHADPHPDRLVDARDLGRRDPAAVHPRATAGCASGPGSRRRSRSCR